ncbi:hypothetical protein PM082_020065 [Marasmius tenuissimus]|nr:hypothetical protein PM082_020065 [Marasmius tenuissimus]
MMVQRQLWWRRDLMLVLSIRPLLRSVKTAPAQSGPIWGYPGVSGDFRVDLDAGPREAESWRWLGFWGIQNSVVITFEVYSSLIPARRSHCGTRPTGIDSERSSDACPLPCPKLAFDIDHNASFFPPPIIFALRSNVLSPCNSSDRQLRAISNAESYGNPSGKSVSHLGFDKSSCVQSPAALTGLAE